MDTYFIVVMINLELTSGAAGESTGHAPIVTVRQNRAIHTAYTPFWRPWHSQRFYAIRRTERPTYHWLRNREIGLVIMNSKYYHR